MLPSKACPAACLPKPVRSLDAGQIAEGRGKGCSGWGGIVGITEEGKELRSSPPPQVLGSKADDPLSLQIVARETGVGLLFNRHIVFEFDLGPTF